jgi:hypothetical protein
MALPGLLADAAAAEVTVPAASAMTAVAASARGYVLLISVSTSVTGNVPPISPSPIGGEWL